MDKNEEKENSLCEMIQHIALKDNHEYCPSIQHLIFAVEDWETTIAILEKRLRHVQQQIKNLNENNY